MQARPKDRSDRDPGAAAPSSPVRAVVAEFDMAALGKRVAEIERAMGVKPILYRTRMRPGY